MLCSLREGGQGLVEYTFLVLLISIAVLLALFVLGPVIGNVFTKLNSKFVTY
jgi:Flp pilus assembly pilin Flp